MASAILSTRARSDRLPAVLVAIGIAALPLLKPTGPGHSTPADAAIGLGILGAIYWAGSTGIKVRMPYAIPFSILVITGLLASLLGAAPTAGFLAIGQEIALFAFAAAIANVVRVPENLTIVLATWAWTASAWASLIVAAALTNRWFLAGVNHISGGRAQFTFDNPNMAAAYFLLSFFVVLLGRYPRNPLLRAYAYVSILGAILLTGSNSGLLSLVVGLLATGLVVVWRRKGFLTFIAVLSAAIVLVTSLAYVALTGSFFQDLTGSSNSLIKRSVARGPRSASRRQTLYSEEFNLYLTGDLLGRGPNSTKDTLEASSGQIVKSAHDDYLASLVERGPVGALGLLLLGGTIVTMAFTLARRPLDAAFARVVPSTPAIVGAVAAIAVTAVTHEILHYRQLWAMLGIIAGIYLFGRKEPATFGPEAGA